MSLVFWSSLDKDKCWDNTEHIIKNNGIINTRLSLAPSSASTLEGVGKVTTKCYSNSSNTTGGYVSNSTLNLGQNQSMFCWAKLNSFYASSNLSGILGCHRYSTNSGMGITVKTVSSTTGYVSVNTGNGSNRTYNTYCGSTLLQANTWYHIGYTYDGSKIRLYVNGNLDGEHNFTGMSVPADYFQVGAWSFSGSSGNALYENYKLNGLINDVRVYNHTLSNKEVKEISKGLAMHYDFENYPLNNKVFDCSGFGNNGTFGSALTLSDNSIIGTHCAVFNGTVNAAICCGTGAKLTDATTVNWWGYMDNWSSYGRAISCTEGGGWNFESASSKMQWPIYLAGIGYKTCQSTMTLANLSSGWHMFTGTYDGFTSKIYVDGVFQNQVSSGASTRTAIGYHSTNAVFIGAEAAASATSPTTPYFTGKIGDVKIFGTALSAEDILAEYNRKASIDRNGNLFTGRFVENSDVTNTKIEKNNTVVSKTFSEFITLSDGSIWAPIVVHNIESGVFSARNQTFLYDNNQRWNSFSSINSLERPESGWYEFLVIQQTNFVNGTKHWWRFKQNVNPLTAAWADVNPSKVGTNVTRIESNISWTTNSGAGMYWHGTDDPMCFANTSNGNWYGCGITKAYNGGIPGYANEVVKGMQLVYMRVSNQQLKLAKSALVKANNIIEI